MHIGQHVVRYVSHSFQRRTIINKSTYWSFVIFDFQTVIAFSILHAFLFLIAIFDFPIFLLIFFNIILYLTFAYFKLSFNDSMNQLFYYVGEFFVSSKNGAALTLINQLHTDALIKNCSVKQMFTQLRQWRIQNPVKHLQIFFAKKVNVNYFSKKALSQMFDWLLKTPRPLEGYYLHDLSSFYVHTVVLECFKKCNVEFEDCNVVQDRSFKEILSLT